MILIVLFIPKGLCF